jgi:hypothetical protein
LVLLFSEGQKVTLGECQIANQGMLFQGPRKKKPALAPPASTYFILQVLFFFLFFFFFSFRAANFKILRGAMYKPERKKSNN